MLSSDIILTDINRCLLTPLTLSLSLHSLICTPCSSSNIDYEKKVMLSHTRSCSSQYCNPNIHPQVYPSLHMSDDGTSSQSTMNRDTDRGMSSNISQSVRKPTIRNTSFIHNLFNLIITEINSLNKFNFYGLRRLLYSRNPSQLLVVSSNSNTQELISLYLIFIRRSFYSAQVILIFDFFFILIFHRFYI